MSMVFNVLSGLSTLILDEIILFGHALWLSFPDLLLTELSLIVLIFTHSIQIMLDLLLLSTNFFHSSHLLIYEVFVPDVDLLFLFLLSSKLGRCFCISLSLFLLFFLSPLEYDIVVFSLQVLQLLHSMFRKDELRSAEEPHCVPINTWLGFWPCREMLLISISWAWA